MNKVLIITYYWPPSGGSGVQRWLKFVKYLPSYHWEPHVFTPENPAFALRDPSLEKDVPPEAEVTRFPIWEPYSIFHRLTSLLKSEKQSGPAALVPSKNKSLFQKISTWIRGNLFVPDPRRFWIQPSARFLAEYITDNRISIVVTTGPPHSVHLIGLKLKEKLPHIRWLADFRDPWSEWGIWDSLMVSKPVRRLHQRMETNVLRKADEILTITPFYVKRFEKLAGRPVRYLPNGFDESDFEGFVYRRPPSFLIRHVGIVNERCDPRPFMKALKAEMHGQPSFAEQVKLEFVGDVHPDFRAFVAGDPELSRITVFVGNVPHNDLMPMYASSALLLFILTGYKDGEGFLPGKLFEYLATGLPVLGVGPLPSDASSLLQESGAGVMIASEDEDGIRSALRSAYAGWHSNATTQSRKHVTGFSRREITGRLAEILEQQAKRSPGR